MEQVTLIETEKLRPKNQSLVSCTQKIFNSIKARGIINPLLVTEDYQVYIGNQRLAAVCSLGIERVPCVIVRSSDDVKAALSAYCNINFESYGVD